MPDADDDYWFDEEAADDVVGFFSECLVHVQGHLAGEPFELLPWQEQMLREVFGWKREDGTRRYRKLFAEVPRKNGKSFLASGLALYMLLCEGEPGAQVFSAASTRDQAALVFNMAADMIRKAPDPVLRKVTKLRDSNKRIIANNGIYRAISSDAAGAHGFNASCVIIDELHVVDREFFNVLDTSTGARAQPLTVMITTAGFDRTSICYELHRYAESVQQGLIVDPSFYAAVFAADAEDDWRDEATWMKANPSLGHAVTLDYLKEQATRAEENPALENTFRRLHLNQWTENESRIIPMHAYDACAVQYTEADLYGRQCFAGLDLASTQDVTAFVLVFPEEDGGCKVLPWFWLPEDNVSQRAKQDQQMIRTFAERGMVELTEGNEIDTVQVAQQIADICEQFDVIKIGFDGWNAAGPTQLMKLNGIPETALEKMPQTTATFNEPFRQMLAWIGNGKFKHNGNAVMRWMAANTVAREDTGGRIKPDKKKSQEKIDGIVSCLMGMALQIKYGSDAGAYTEDNAGVILF